MNKTQTKLTKRNARHNRIRARVTGTADKPRLAVFKSNSAIYAQLINDETATTLAAADSRKAEGANLTEKAKVVGAEIAKKAQEKKVENVVFDRGGFRYIGVIAALADAAREAGLKF